MSAAVNRPFALHAVPQNAAVTMRARRSEQGRRALDRIERVRLALPDHLKCLVVVVSANITYRHVCLLSGTSVAILFPRNFENGRTHGFGWTNQAQERHPKIKITRTGLGAIRRRETREKEPG